MARGDVGDRQLPLHGGAHPLALIRRLPTRIRVIHRGTDFATFSPSAVAPERVEALRKAWGVAPHERIVLLAARLTGWKGQKVLIEAAASFKARGLADVAFVLAGDPQGRDCYVRELDQLIATRRAHGLVRRVGHCADMPAAFLAASVVTVPSTEPEAFGRSAVEAQAMGTPVVVSDLGAVPETVLAPPEVSAPASAPAGACRRAMPRRSPRRSRRRSPWAPAPARPWRRGRASCRAAFLARAHGGKTRSMSTSALLEGRAKRARELT